MKIYENNIRIARLYLKNGEVDHYKNQLDGLIRSAKSDEAITYLEEVKFIDLHEYQHHLHRRRSQVTEMLKQASNSPSDLVINSAFE